MSERWLPAAMFALVSVTLGCQLDPETCPPGEGDCKVATDSSRPTLSSDEVEARLDELHDRFEHAAADGLDPDECKELAAAYQGLYDKNTTMKAARFNLGVVHEHCGEIERAEQVYTELGEHPQALNNRGVLVWQRGEYEVAFDLFERSIAADRTHAFAARNNLAMALRERYARKVDTTDFDRAEQELQNVLAVDSANKAAYENLARLYYDRGRLDDESYLVLANLVVSQATRVLAQAGEGSADLHNIRGLLLMQRDDQVNALRAFKRAVEVEPEHPDANRNIAMVAIRFRDFAEAERALERVLTEPEVSTDPDAWLALGVAKRGLRKYDEAATAYREAAQVDGSDPRPWFNLGVLAQDHLSAEARDEALQSVYEEAKTHYETCIARARDVPRWRDAVAEATDRIAIIDDAIETLEKMEALEAAIAKIDEEARLARLAEIERLRELESKGVSVEELTNLD